MKRPRRGHPICGVGAEGFRMARRALIGCGRRPLLRLHLEVDYEIIVALQMKNKKMSRIQEINAVTICYYH